MSDDDMVDDQQDVPEEGPAEAPNGLDRREEGRRKEGERRDIIDRRTGLDRRRGPGVRRTESRRAAEEGEMTPDQFEFLQAINEYKKVNRRPFPTWSEVLDVMRALGYRKVAEPSDIE